MDAGIQGTTAETHLNDVQAEIEKGYREVCRLQQTAVRIRDSLLRDRLRQAALMGSLIKRIVELRSCVRQQRMTMRELRHDVRTLRELLKNTGE